MHLTRSIERLIELSPALRAFNLDGPFMLSPSAARTLLSRHSLKVLDIYDWPSEEDFSEKLLSQPSVSNVQALGLSQLDILCDSDFVSKFTNLKSVYLRQYMTRIYSHIFSQERPVKFPWAHMIKELNLDILSTHCMRQIGTAYEVYLF